MYKFANTAQVHENDYIYSFDGSIWLVVQVIEVRIAIKHTVSYRGDTTNGLMRDQLADSELIVKHLVINVIAVGDHGEIWINSRENTNAISKYDFSQ